MNMYRGRARQPWMRRIFPVSVFVLALLNACKDLTPALPAGTPDPTTLQNQDGAMSMYRGALLAASQGFNGSIWMVGEFTDELRSASVGAPSTVGAIISADSRNVTDTYNNVTNLFRALNVIRTHAHIAIDALRNYAPESLPTLRAELYSLQGYAEVLLAEIFCSGIPLSTVDFDKDYTLQRGSSTSEVYTHAIALFDSALALERDTASIVNLARVGKARALLGLGRFTEAGAIVADVPDTFHYDLPMVIGVGQTFASVFQWSVSDKEGGTGLPFRSTRDPRSAVRSNGKMRYINDSIWVPKKYDIGAPVFRVANGIEARLIAAESNLWGGGTQWLHILNLLRTDSTFTTRAPDPSGHVDTLWHAGVGGVAGLRPLNDPAIDPLPPGKDISSVRQDLLFAERGYWLFLTGHRQGDLRRLIHSYKRDPETVYPTGIYDPNGLSIYGTDVTMPIPESEQLRNPVYHGCIDRLA